MQIIIGNHFNHNYTISFDLYYYWLLECHKLYLFASQALPGHNQSSPSQSRLTRGFVSGPRQ